MKARFLALAAIAALCLPALAQNMTQITASKIQSDAGGTLLGAGHIKFLPTNSAGQAISFQAGGGGQVSKAIVSCTVVNGVITTKDVLVGGVFVTSASGGVCVVANTALTNPRNVCYAVKWTDTSQSGAEVQGAGYGCYQPTGSISNFDNFIPNSPSFPTITGLAATIAAGTASPLAAGATPTVTNAGTASDAVFNFGIPAGAPGATGSAGTNGTGIQAFTAVPNQWINAIAANGTASSTQPAFSNLSGAATAAQLPAVAVQTGQANTYSAGMKQSVQSSATTAGFNFGGVTADPSGLVSGDHWFNTTSKHLKLYDGVASQTLALNSDLAALASRSAANTWSGLQTFTSPGTSDWSGNIRLNHNYPAYLMRGDNGGWLVGFDATNPTLGSRDFAISQSNDDVVSSVADWFYIHANNPFATLSGAVSIGATSLVLNTTLTLAGGATTVLLGTITANNQELATVSAGSGTTTLTVSALTKNHSINEVVQVMGDYSHQATIGIGAGNAQDPTMRLNVFGDQTNQPGMGGILIQSMGNGNGGEPFRIQSGYNTAGTQAFIDKHYALMLQNSATPRVVTDGVLNATTTISSATLAADYHDVGDFVLGTGIPTGAYITAYTNTTITISAAATATASGVTLTVEQPAFRVQNNGLLPIFSVHNSLNGGAGAVLLGTLAMGDGAGPQNTSQGTLSILRSGTTDATLFVGSASWGAFRAKASGTNPGTVTLDTSGRGVPMTIGAGSSGTAISISTANAVTVSQSLQVGASGTAITQSTVYSPSITPVAVAAQTCADQDFTGVTGLVTTDTLSRMITPVAGMGNVGIDGSYSTVNGTLRIHFCNPSLASVTPPAGTYTFRATH